MTSSFLISTFISNFKYLNANGKRKGLFTCFNNSSLTIELEMIAKKLRADLFKLDQEKDKNDHDKCVEMLSLFRNAFLACEQVRESQADWYHYKYEQYIGPHRDCTTAGVSYDYKIPYKPATFEKKLINGVEACIEFLKFHQNLNAVDLKKELCTLWYEISHFSPKEIRKNECNWAP